jgi:hypothetical protein
MRLHIAACKINGSMLVSQDLGMDFGVGLASGSTGGLIHLNDCWNFAKTGTNACSISQATVTDLSQVLVDHLNVLFQLRKPQSALIISFGLTDRRISKRQSFMGNCKCATFDARVLGEVICHRNNDRQYK